MLQQYFHHDTTARHHDARLDEQDPDLVGTEGAPLSWAGGWGHWCGARLRHVIIEM
jgi:hypothetical protein